MKSTILFFCLFGFYTIASGQQIFFTSPVPQKKDDRRFYSSIRMQNDLLLFNANDYYLYAYDKNTQQLKWSYYLNWKSDRAPFIVNNQVWCQTTENEMVRLNAATGDTLTPLPMAYVLTTPFIKNNKAYFTCLFYGGSLTCYDLVADSVQWNKFIAHGCEKQAYFFADRIIANAEGYNWIAFDYNGNFKDKECEGKEYNFPGELPCAEQFGLLTHDNKKFNSELLENGYDYREPDVLRTSSNTFILSTEHLMVIGDKLKIKEEIAISSLGDSLEIGGYFKILSATNKEISFIHSNHFFRYDLPAKKLVKDIDLTNYIPHQALLEENRLWMIAEKDGLLYGMLVQ